MKYTLRFLTLTILFFKLHCAVSQTIKIQLPDSKHPVSDLYKPGMFLVPKNEASGLDFIHNGIHHNSIRTIALENALNFSGPSIGAVLGLLEAQKADILYMNSRCDKLVIPILKMPLWLSSSSDTTVLGDPNWRIYNAMPPKDYATWNILMDSIVHKINEQWGLDPYYEIWNEPDNFYWQGTPAQYFSFFKNSYFAIKTKHPGAKVGGPVLASFTSKFGSAYPVGFITDAEFGSSIMGSLIDSCVKWHAPLDFVSWHKFDSFLHSIPMEMDYLNRKLVLSGHGKVPYLISEYNNAYHVRESNFAAAFMPNYILSLEQYGVAGHVVASLQDFEPEDTEFHQDYGMLSWAGLHKPEWNALLLLDKIKGTKIETPASDYLNLAICSAIENDTLRVLLSNRSLPAFTEATAHILYHKHFNERDLTAAGYTAQRLDSVYKGHRVVSGLDSLSLSVNSAIPVYKIADSAFKYGRDISLTIEGLTGIYHGLQFLIDSSHNNVIHSYDSLLSAGFNRSSAATYLYNNAALQSKVISLKDSVYSLHLQPNAVTLLEFYIPNITDIHKETLLINAFELFPNPSSDILTVKVNQPGHIDETILIYNSEGILIKNIETRQVLNPIDVSDLKTGLYFVALKSHQQKALKFVKE
jgi:hypothetical protein